MVRTRRAERVALAESASTDSHGLTELHHDIFADFAEAGDAHFLSRASLLNKAHHAAAKAAWASLSVPVPKNMQVQIARFLLDETLSLPHFRTDEGRVASLLQASGRSLKQLGVTQVCTECSHCTPVPDWSQFCQTCFGNAEVARRKESPAHANPAHANPKVLLAWSTRTMNRLIMWECEACDIFSSNTDPELGAGHECMACHEVHHARCNPHCEDCDTCCCEGEYCQC